MHAVLLADEGEGRPLVYVPGIDGTGEFLFGTAERLQKRFRLLRLRYVGDGPDTYRHLAATIDALLAERGVDRCLLIAESFGGAVALQTALDHAQRVAGVALVNSFAYYPAKLRLALGRVFAPLVWQGLFRFVRRRLGVWALFGPRREPDAIAQFFAREATRFDAAYRARMAMLARVDLRPRLHDVEQPVALFTADCDRVVSPRGTEEMGHLLPNASIQSLERAGHLVLPLRAFPWVDWLEQLAERATMPAP